VPGWGAQGQGRVLQAGSDGAFHLAFAVLHRCAALPRRCELLLLVLLMLPLAGQGTGTRGGPLEPGVAP